MSLIQLIGIQVFFFEGKFLYRTFIRFRCYLFLRIIKSFLFSIILGKV